MTLVQHLDNPDSVKATYEQFRDQHSSWLDRKRNTSSANMQGLPNAEIFNMGTYGQVGLLYKEVSEFLSENQNVDQAIGAMLYRVSIWGRQIKGDPQYPVVFPEGRPGQNIEDFDPRNSDAPEPLNDWTNPSVIGLASCLLAMSRNRKRSKGPDR